MIRLSLLFICLLSISGIAQTKAPLRKNSSEIRAIETYCKQIDAFIKSHKTRVRILATIDDGEKWREFKSEKARQKADEGDNLNENAMVWVRNRKLVYAGFTFQSLSQSSNICDVIDRRERCRSPEHGKK